jgi:hypothetical protein
MFGVLIAITKNYGHWADRVGVMMFKMSLAIGIMAAVIALLSLLDPKELIGPTAAVSSLMLCFAAIVNAMKYINKHPPSLKNLVPMLAVVAGLAALVWGMSYIPNPDKALIAAAGVSLLMVSMSAALALMSLSGPMASKSVGALLLLGFVVAELGAILGLMSHFDVNPSIETALSLSTLLLAMSGSLVLLGLVGTAGPAAFVGIAALAALIAGIGALVVGIGALMNKFPQLEDFLNRGIPVIEKIGFAIGGSAVGYLIAWAGYVPPAGEVLGYFTHMNRYMMVIGLIPAVIGAVSGIITLLFYKLSDDEAAMYAKANAERDAQEA